VGALHSHSNKNTKHFGEILETSMKIVNVERKVFYLLRGFNNFALSNNNTVDERFINNMQSIGVHQMFTLPTRFVTSKTLTT